MRVEIARHRLDAQLRFSSSIGAFVLDVSGLVLIRPPGSGVEVRVIEASECERAALVAFGFEVVDESTRHVSAAARCVAHPFRHGLWLWVPDAREESMDGDTAPAEVAAVQRYARALDCEYVCFDEDSGLSEDLPTFAAD